jgi:rRNA-processing protein FCF1
MTFVPFYFTWRPMSPDRGDDHLIDCAMNSGAVIVTSNVKDFRIAAESLGVPVFTPVEFLVWLTDQF